MHGRLPDADAMSSIGPSTVVLMQGAAIHLLVGTNDVESTEQHYVSTMGHLGLCPEKVTCSQILMCSSCAYFPGTSASDETVALLFLWE